MAFKKLALVYTLAIIFGIINGNNISCDGYRSCFNMTQNCVKDEDCFINCYGKYACFLSTFVCPSGPYNCVIDANPGLDSYSLIASSINGSDMNGGNLTVTCNGFWSCPENVFNCPQNGDCVFIGGDIGWSIFMYSTFKAHSTTNMLSITGQGNNILAETNVYCPNSRISGPQNNCLIYVFGSGSNMIKNLYIYSIESFTDISLICNYSTSVEVNCYDAIVYSPIMICDEQLSSSCVITLDDFYPKCSDNTSICQDYTFQPTVHPTVSTDIPTNYPSYIPTTSVTTMTLPSITTSKLLPTEDISNANFISPFFAFVLCHFCEMIFLFKN